jgi:hypothetical protein
MDDVHFTAFLQLGTGGTYSMLMFDPTLLPCMVIMLILDALWLVTLPIVLAYEHIERRLGLAQVHDLCCVMLGMEVSDEKRGAAFLFLNSCIAIMAGKSRK